MTDTLADRDEAARCAAIEPSRSVLLEAPAGSGKTAVLTRRFLKLLGTVESPGEVLAITFTRKAAAEMRARVTEALREATGTAGGPDSELRALARQALAHGAARGWEIAAQPQLLRIQTIDSFNYWLATQLPVASRAGGVLTVTDAADELYQRAARRALLDADAGGALATDVRLLFERFDNQWLPLERLIARMLGERAHWLRFVADTDPARLCERVNDSLEAATRGLLSTAHALLPNTLRHQAERLPGCAPLGVELVDLVQWQSFSRLVLTGDAWRRQVSVRLGPEFADAAARARLRELIETLVPIAGLREALARISHAPAGRLDADEAAALAALSRVLARAAAELHAQFAAAGRVDHTYVTGAARAALTDGGEPTDLALRTGLRLKHVLVDEFQDTSLAQFELLEILTAGWEPGDGRTLFVVGDPMQSIYRFRDAEVGLFLKAREQGIGCIRLESLRLARNFRSAPELVSFVNGLFKAVLPPADDLRAGAVTFRASFAARTPEPLAGAAAVSCRLFPGGPLEEARAVAARAAQLRRLDPEASVAILVVAHAHAAPVVAALESLAVPALGVDLVALRERAVVRDLVQLTRALHDPADRPAWLALLRAPWCGAQLATLSALSEPADTELVIEALFNPQRLARCNVEDVPRLERVREVLSRALAVRVAAESVTDWIESTWLRLGASDAYPPAAVADARAFFAALADAAATHEWLGPEDLPRLLARLYSQPPAGDHPIQVMTIHRAKGLEFDHVLLPALERGTRRGERRLLRWIDVPGESRASELLIAPAPATSLDGSRLYEYVGALQRERDVNERRRLLYVAVTRARRTLWLSAAPAQDRQGALRHDPGSPLAQLWNALAAHWEIVPAGPAPNAAMERRRLQRLVSGWKSPQPAARPSWSLLPAAYVVSDPPEFSWVGETQRHIGTIVHAWLAHLSQEPSLPAAAAVATQRDTVLARLAHLGVPERERQRAAHLILEAVQRTLTDERGRWILDAGHRSAHSEWELSGVAHGRLRSVKIDRSFIDEEGTRWVIDYKSSLHEGAGLEAFIGSELDRYRAQLEGYIGIAAAIAPGRVRAALYFPLLGAFRELT